MFDEIEKRRPLSDSLQELEKWHAVGDIRDAFGRWQCLAWDVPTF